MCTTSLKYFYFKKFVTHLAVLAAPQHDLTLKKNKVTEKEIFHSDQEKAHKKLSVLIIPDLHKPFEAL